MECCYDLSSKKNTSETTSISIDTRYLYTIATVGMIWTYFKKWRQLALWKEKTSAQEHLLVELRRKLPCR